MIKFINGNYNFYYLNFSFKLINQLKKVKKKYIFKKKNILFNNLNLLNIYILNKNYNNKKNITESLTFNYFKTSLIFINFNMFRAKHLKSDFFLIFNFYIIHCILHAQDFKDNNRKNLIILNKIQHKVLISMGFLCKLSVIGVEPTKI